MPCWSTRSCTRPASPFPVTTTPGWIKRGVRLKALGGVLFLSCPQLIIEIPPDCGGTMDRRRFLQNLAVTTATIQDLVRDASTGRFADSPAASSLVTNENVCTEIDTTGYTQVSEFKTGSNVWKVYEDRS